MTHLLVNYIFIYVHFGGYVQHILNIVHYSKEFYKIWKDNGSIDDYTMEELVFTTTS